MPVQSVGQCTQSVKSATQNEATQRLVHYYSPESAARERARSKQYRPCKHSDINNELSDVGEVGKNFTLDKIHLHWRAANQNLECVAVFIR